MQRAFWFGFAKGELISSESSDEMDGNGFKIVDLKTNKLASNLNSWKGDKIFSLIFSNDSYKDAIKTYKSPWDSKITEWKLPLPTHAPRVRDNTRIILGMQVDLENGECQLFYNGGTQMGVIYGDLPIKDKKDKFGIVPVFALTNIK